MVARIALAGDTMLGRGVAEVIRAGHSLVGDDVAEALKAADVAFLNLECCVSERGEHWPDPHKRFFFRAPPQAAGMLADWGVTCVTLANNHALDFGEEALLDTLSYLDAAGIRWVGAGPEIEAARTAVVLDAGGLRLGVVALTDHPHDYDATGRRAGVAYADLRGGRLPEWVHDRIVATRAASDAVLVTVHWGPNMVAAPVPHVRAAAPAMLEAGATVIAGHSAHVFHGADLRGVWGVMGVPRATGPSTDNNPRAPGATTAPTRGHALLPVLWDLGDFLDDYAVDPVLRNDLGLLWFVTLDAGAVARVEALPLKLDYCFTTVAGGDDRDWIRRRLRSACVPFGTGVAEQDGRFLLTR